MIIANAGTALAYFFASDFFVQNLPSNPPTYLIIVLGVIGLVNLFFSIMLLRWKKWAFWGFGISSIFALMVNLMMGIGVTTSLGGLVGIAILYGILQIKQDGKSAWELME